MKISVNTYSFSNARTEAGASMTQFEMIDFAKENGFDAIEIVGLQCGEESPLEYAKKLLAQAKKAGIEISCYTVGADLLAEGGVDNVLREVDVAEALGVKIMRRDAAWNCPEGKTFEDVLPVLGERCRIITEYAQGKGVRTTVENHGFFVQDAHRMVVLVKAVNHPNFGLLCDIGNFMCADEISVNSVSQVAPYAIYVHAKDFLYKSAGECVDGNAPSGYFATRGGNYLRGTITGNGVVNLAECMKILKAAGYDGYVSLEFEGPEEPLSAIKEGLENIRKAIM